MNALWLAYYVLCNLFLSMCAVTAFIVAIIELYFDICHNDAHFGSFDAVVFLFINIWDFL